MYLVWQNVKVVEDSSSVLLPKKCNIVRWLLYLKGNIWHVSHA